MSFGRCSLGISALFKLANLRVVIDRADDHRVSPRAPVSTIYSHRIEHSHKM